jgi:hypothetical protein
MDKGLALVRLSKIVGNYRSPNWANAYINKRKTDKLASFIVFINLKFFFYVYSIKDSHFMDFAFEFKTTEGILLFIKFLSTVYQNKSHQVQFQAKIAPDFLALNICNII